MSTKPTSDEFDPLLALNSTIKSSENVKVYDNIAVFEANMTRKDATETPQVSRQKEKSFSQRKRIATEVKNRDVSKLKELMEIRKKMDEESGKPTKKVEKSSSKQRPPFSNLFTVMEKLSVGPLSLLYKITKECLRCRVYTRHFSGLRGVLVGFVVAFDRYMNLAMVDIDETFIICPRGDVANHQKKLSTSQLEKALKHIEKHGIETNKHSLASSIPHHHVTGVVKQKSSVSTVFRKQSSKAEDTDFLVKRFDNLHIPPSEEAQTFHRGSPQLYHRHVNNLYVRGDSVVLLQLHR